MNLALEGIIVLVMMLATWFAADAYYSKQYAGLKAEEIQSAKDQQLKADDEQIQNKMVTKEVNDAALAQIAALRASVDDLSVRKPATVTLTRVVCAATPSASSPPDALGRATAGDVGPPASLASPTASLDASTLADALDTAIWGVRTQLLQREYEAKTGQISQSK